METQKEREKSAENSVLENFPNLILKKLYTSRSSVNFSRVSRKRTMPRNSIVNLLKDRRENLESIQERNNSLRTGSTSMINDWLPSQQTLGARRQCNDIIWSAEWKHCLWIILYLAKLTFRNEGEINTFLCKDWGNL